MSAQVFFPQEAIANQSILGEAGNDSSGPASVLASTPESGSPPLATEAISDNLPKKHLENHSSCSMEQDSQNGHSGQSKFALSNGSSHENSTAIIITQTLKLTNGHHDVPSDNSEDVVTSSNPESRPEVTAVTKPEIKETSETKDPIAVQEMSITPVVEPIASVAAVPPAAAPAPEQEKVTARSSLDDTDSSSYEPDLGAEETDASYASDLESAVADLPR